MSDRAEKHGDAPALPEAAKSVDELIAATGGGVNATFNFRHKIFALPGARFAIDHHARAAMFYIHLGNLNVSVTPAVLRREFNIEPGSHDSELMELAAQGLRHVKEVRPGDSIPKELIDGTASWTVEERHHLLAKARLLSQVAGWFTADKSAASIERILAMSEQDIAAKAEFQSGFAAIAQSLGLPPERKAQIVDHIDSIARELCYIEALRDYAGRLRLIHEKLAQLAHLALNDRPLGEEIARVLTLLKQPLLEFSNRFAQIDQQTGDLLGLLRNPHRQIKLIRDVRDAIHSSLLPWSEIFERWESQAIVLNHDAESNIRLLHHWLAANYAPARVWR